MQRLIYPFETISFSQLEYGNYSHKNIPAVDMTGKDTGKDVIYAPCDLEIINIPKNNESHTIYYKSLEKVLCADGFVRQVTIACTHCDDISMYKVGQQFKTGEPFYKEGVAGNATGNHVHIEVAEGIVPSKKYVWIGGKKYWRFPEEVALKPTDVFFALNLWSMTRKLMGVELVWCDAREFTPDELTVRVYSDMGTQGIRKKISVNKEDLVAVMPKGSFAYVSEIIKGRQFDGYQWLKIHYEGYDNYKKRDVVVDGYMQFDGNWDLLEEG